MHVTQAVFVAEVEVLREELRECTLTVEGEFVSEGWMKDEWGWSECLGERAESVCARISRERVKAVKAHCKSQPQKLIRPKGVFV